MDVKINNSIFREIEQIQVPKKDGTPAIFQSVVSKRSLLNLAGLFANTEPIIDDANGEIKGVITTRMTNNNTVLQSVHLPKARNVRDEAFRGCTNLTYVEMEECPYVQYRGFRDCSRLETAIFPECTSVGDEAFCYCGNLKNVNLPKATWIGTSSFNGCSQLETLSLPSIKDIYGASFYNCSSLRELNIENCVKLDGADIFQNTPNLPQSFTFPNLTTMIWDRYIFRNSNFKEITMPKMTYVSHRNFRDDKNIETINMPECTALEAEAFCYDTALKNVNIPKVTRIQRDAFNGCTALETVNFPKLTNLNEGNIFVNCSNLKTVLLTNKTQVCSLGNINSFSGTPIATSETEGFIYVPVELVDSYKNATNWSTYGNKIKGYGKTINFTIKDPETTVLYINNQLVSSTLTEYVFGGDVNSFTYTMYGTTGSPVSATVDISDTDFITPKELGELSLNESETTRLFTLNITYPENTKTIITINDELTILNGTSVAIESGSKVYYKVYKNGYETVEDTINSLTEDTTIDISLYFPNVFNVDLSYPFEIEDLPEFLHAETLVNTDFYPYEDDSIQVLRLHNTSARPYIKFTTPNQASVLTIDAYVSSEGGYDYGYIYLEKTLGEKNFTILKSSGTNNTMTTYTKTLLGNTEYYLSFQYTKDRSVDSGYDSLLLGRLQFQVKDPDYVEPSEEPETPSGNDPVEQTPEENPENNGE